MIYLDTSCLLKLLRDEDYSDAVDFAVQAEDSVIISSLAELEALTDLKARFLGGEHTRAQWRRMEFELYQFRNTEPFEFRIVPSGVWDIAFRQHRNSVNSNCRSLDRLHLAAAEKFRITRFMTHDNAQADAARELGMEVVQPGLKD